MNTDAAEQPAATTKLTPETQTVRKNRNLEKPPKYFQQLTGVKFPNFQFFLTTAEAAKEENRILCELREAVKKSNRRHSEPRRGRMFVASTTHEFELRRSDMSATKIFMQRDMPLLRSLMEGYGRVLQISRPSGANDSGNSDQSDFFSRPASLR